MKDPLCTEETPYEVLGVAHDAGRSEISAAFKAAVGKGGNPQRLTAARNKLQQPLERALLDLFEYSPEELSGVTPSPVDDPSALDQSHRSATAEAWEELLRVSFPNFAVAHSLAILWYWWAVSEEQSLAESEPDASGDGDGAGGDPSHPTVTDMWEHAIAHWTMVATSAPSVGPLPGSAGIPPEVGDRVLEVLRSRLDDLAGRYRARGALAQANRYRQLELALSTELATARTLAAAGIWTPNGLVTCGALLRELGRLDDMSRQIERLLEQDPSNVRLRSLRDALSPHAQIAVLVEGGKAEEALQTIEALPHDERDSAEVAILKARALIVRGRQQASLDRHDDALESWARAI